jgi:hypothetical protein
MSPGIHADVRRRVRYVQAHAEASARARTGVESAAGGRRPLAHADEAEPGRAATAVRPTFVTSSSTPSAP